MGNSSLFLRPRSFFLLICKLDRSWQSDRMHVLRHHARHTIWYRLCLVPSIPGTAPSIVTPTTSLCRIPIIPLSTCYPIPLTTCCSIPLAIPLAIALVTPLWSWLPVTTVKSVSSEAVVIASYREARWADIAPGAAGWTAPGICVVTSTPR